MKTVRPRLIPAVLALCAALALSACGSKEAETKVGKTEGAYLNVGPLLYQVQISRQLNPRDVEDKSYLLGLPAGTAELNRDEAWFAVFMRVQNASKHAAPTARPQDYEIVDTQHNRYTPIVVDANANPFAYAQTVLGKNRIYPNPDSASGNGPIQGSMLLFRVKVASFGDRPMDLLIHSPEDPQDRALVSLDV